ncbi:MAG: hypothetical protein AAGA68_16460 [Pseudomonadota bacterium]
MFSVERSRLPPSTAPAPIQRFGSGETVFGSAREVAARVIEEGSAPQKRITDSLADQVRECTYEGDKRRRYVAAGASYLKRKRPRLQRCYDVVVIGAGVHTASFLHTLKRAHPHLSVLGVERTATICATFRIRISMQWMVLMTW